MAVDPIDYVPGEVRAKPASPAVHGCPVCDWRGPWADVEAHWLGHTNGSPSVGLAAHLIGPPVPGYGGNGDRSGGPRGPVAPKEVDVEPKKFEELDALLVLLASRGVSRYKGAASPGALITSDTDYVEIEFFPPAAAPVSAPSPVPPPRGVSVEDFLASDPDPVDGCGHPRSLHRDADGVCTEGCHPALCSRTEPSSTPAPSAA